MSHWGSYFDNRPLFQIMSPDPLEQAADKAVAEEIEALRSSIPSPFRVATADERQAMGIGATDQLVSHKPGVKTSEFWLLVLVIIGAWAPVYLAGMEPQWAAALNTVSGIAWAYCRALVKAS